MKIQDICRETTTVVEFDQPLSNLAQEAEEVLGYSRLKQEKEEPKSNLQAKLAAIQIDVLKRSDVMTYMSEILAEQTKAKLAEWLKNPSSQFWGPGWRRAKIADYKEPIPEFVLNKAIQIKKQLPDCLIFIESLEDYHDPFLVIATKHPQYECLTEEEHYVEVWEEPKFEGRIR